MLFAAYDYIRYRTGTGHYSPVALSKEGGVLASQDLLTIIKPGNLYLLHTKNSFLSWMVMYYGGCPWSHFGFITENLNTMDATTSGMIEHPFSDYLDGQSYICIYQMPQSTPEEIKYATKAMRSEFLGLPYGWHKVIRIFLRKIFGIDPYYRIKYSIDILLVIGFLIWLFDSHLYIKLILTILAGLYGFLVFISVLTIRKIVNKINKLKMTTQR